MIGKVISYLKILEKLGEVGTDFHAVSEEVNYRRLQ